MKVVRQFLWYALFGGLSTLLYWGLFFALSAWLGVDYRLATAIGYGTGSIFNYGLQKVVTFRDRSSRVGRQLVLYAIVQGLSLLASVASMALLVDGVGVPDKVALVLTTGAVLLLNFVGHRFLTFRERERGNPPHPDGVVSASDPPRSP